MPDTAVGSGNTVLEILIVFTEKQTRQSLIHRSVAVHTGSRFRGSQTVVSKTPKRSC